MNWLLTLLLPVTALAQVQGKTARYYQVVIPFTEVHEYEYQYNEQHNTLEVFVAQAKPTDFRNLDFYDDRLIRRVMITDRGPEGAGFTLTFRDDRVRATLTDFKEPFRIILDLFDKYYSETRDPQTGLPTTIATETNTVAQPQSDPSPAERDGAAPLVGQAPKAMTQTKLKGRKKQPSKHKLIRPNIALELQNPRLQASISKIPEGGGTFWNKFPLYIYRLQSAVYTTGKNYDDWLQTEKIDGRDRQTLTADYAAELFNFGHEAKALSAYQSILGQRPKVFDQIPIHLWNLGEIHTGLGNLTLADGYYEALIRKHPDHELAKFAQLRRADLQALTFIRNNRPNELAKLKPLLQAIEAGENAELQSQIAIRSAYWHPKKAAELRSILADRHFLPVISDMVQASLNSSYKNSENNNTTYLASALLLNNWLEDRIVWSKDIAEFGDTFLDRYRGEAVAPIRNYLAQKLTQKLRKTIINLGKENRLADIVALNEALPPRIHKKTEEALTSWYLGEGYRQAVRPDDAALFYQQAARLFPAGKERFKSRFWSAWSHFQAAQNPVLTKTDSSDSRKWSDLAKREDKMLLATFNDLNEELQNDILQEMAEPFEMTIWSDTLYETPALLKLQYWQGALSTKSSASGNAEPEQQAATETVKAARLLSRLAEKFSQMGRPKERRQALKLMRRLNPESLQDDQDAIAIWSKDLTQLANELKKENQYLEAGRTFTLTGNTADWEGRAEALYKGGLLLFRAGQRTEALEAFTQASQDTNNLLYAELARKRLELIQQQ